MNTKKRSMSIEELTECIAEEREGMEDRTRISMALERIEKSLKTGSTPRRDDLAVALHWALEEVQALKKKNKLLRKKVESRNVQVEPAAKTREGFSQEQDIEPDTTRARALKAARRKMSASSDIFGKRGLE